MREPTSIENDFRLMVEQLFGFLRSAYACSTEIDADNEGVTLRFQNRWVAVELRLEEERRVFIDLVPLTDGTLPPRFDAKGNEPLTRFPLAELIELCETSWRPPTAEDSAEQRDDLLEVLSQYAAALKQCGDGVLRGERATFATIEARMRRRLALVLLEDWARFIDRVRRGFSGGISEYTLGITARGQLEDILQNWKGDPQQDPRTQLAQLDRAFADATEAIGAGPSTLTDKYVVVPAPNAVRWWRRPKDLVGPLRDYFERS